MLDAGPNGRARVQNTFTGATIGSLLGAGSGYLIHEKSGKKESLPPAQFQDSRTRQTPPAPVGLDREPVFVPPKVESRYIDDQVRGNTFVPGHLEYQIVEPGRWERK